MKFLEEGFYSDTENNGSIYSRRKNSAEKELLELSNAIKELNDKVIDFFGKNENHKIYLESTTFYETTEDNDRFCRFCLIKKVKS